MNTEIQKVRPTPAIVRTNDGKERIETGRWSLKAMADYVANHPALMLDYKQLARVGRWSAMPAQAETTRRAIRSISNLLEERKILTVIEFSGRKVHAIQVFNRNNEYHQHLMANEIGRRKVRADGSAEKLEQLIQSLPSPVTETEGEK